MPSRDKICAYCKKEFHDISSNNRKICCSDECLERYRTQVREENAAFIKMETAVERVCANPACGRTFKTTHPKKTFCSSECRVEAHAKLLIEKHHKEKMLKRQENKLYCKVCGKEITDLRRRTYCSDECFKQEMLAKSEKRLGEERRSILNNKGELTLERRYLCHLWHTKGDTAKVIAYILSISPEQVEEAVNDGTTVEEKYVKAYGSLPPNVLIENLKIWRNENGTRTFVRNIERTTTGDGYSSVHGSVKRRY